MEKDKKRKIERRVNPISGKLEERYNGDDFWQVVIK